jgi:hypothetical protein
VEKQNAGSAALAAPKNIKNKTDVVLAKKNKVAKAAETKQNAEYAPTINTCVNSIKNKIPDVFAKKGKFDKDDVKTQNAENTTTINT